MPAHSANAERLTDAAAIPSFRWDDVPGWLGRRALLAGLPALALWPKAAHPGIVRDPGAPLSAQWQLFCQRFILPEGRVVDTGNGGISHTEGQGIGLLAAACLGDPVTFAQLLSWTRATLRRPDDMLHAWCYQPDAAVKVADQNNATDGDMLIAHALLVAGRVWNRPDYTALGGAMLVDIQRLLVREVPDAAMPGRQRRVLLPGVLGFDRVATLTLNPSYYIFPTLRRFAAETADPVWTDLARDGVALLRVARFGRWGLTPDWVIVSRLTGKVAPAPGWPARFSYDATRVPLYLSWAGLAQEPAVQAAVAFWQDVPGPPAWADLQTAALAPYQQDGGMAAIRRFATDCCAGQAPRLVASVGDATSYYSAALILLTHLAAAPGLAGII